MLQSNQNFESGVVDSLTEKEKEALRLLLVGHNAKSIAQELNLSVHTVNDRFRSARQKLRVASSREAARVLSIHENRTPENVVANDFGIAASNESSDEFVPQQPRRGVTSWIPRLIGVSFMITAIAAAIMFAMTPASLDLGSAKTDQPTASLSDSKAVTVASNWLELIDAQQFEQSREASSDWLQSQMSPGLFADHISNMRDRLGLVQSRMAVRVLNTNEVRNSNIPNASYTIVEFSSRYENGPELKETVVLLLENGELKPIEYYFD